MYKGPEETPALFVFLSLVFFAVAAHTSISKGVGNIMRGWNLRASRALFVCAILCCGLAPAHGHNFVNFDLGWHTLAPLPKDQIRVTINLLDTDSISKSGDLVRFDALVLQVTEEPVAHASSSSFELKSVIKSHTDQFEASCGWRSLTRLPERDAKGSLIYTAMLLPRGLLRGDEEQNIAIDRICSGAPLHAAQGAKNRVLLCVNENRIQESAAVRSGGRPGPAIHASGRKN